MSDSNEKEIPKYEVLSENLAFPEIVTGKVKNKDDEDDLTGQEIVYDDLAIPEIHIKINNKEAEKKKEENNEVNKNENKEEKE